jgi:putative restriction endonuclease
MNNSDRAVLKQTLLQNYFPQIHQLTSYATNSIANEISNQILKESTATYQRQIEKADEEEIFIRNGVFKKLLPSIYNNCCCISRMRVISTYNIQMIDACHIIPFAISHDDTIINGIPLCPNLHRAFDRGLITIDENYKVIVSQSFHEDKQVYSIRQYEGIQIALPSERNYYPAVENLEWHRKHVFK